MKTLLLAGTDANPAAAERTGSLITALAEPEVLLTVAPMAPVNRNWNRSAGSAEVSISVLTVTVFDVSPGWNRSDPVVY